METPPTSFSSLSALFPTLEMTRSDSLESLTPVKPDSYPPRTSQESPTLQRAPSLSELLRALEQIETLVDKPPPPRINPTSDQNFSLPRIPSYAGSYCVSPRLPSEVKGRTFSQTLGSLEPANGESKNSRGKVIADSKAAVATITEWKDTQEKKSLSQTQNSTPAVFTPLTETPFLSTNFVSLGLDYEDPANGCSSSEQSLSSSTSL